MTVVDPESFDRAWNAGFEHGAMSEIVALAYEQVADEMLRVCGISRSDTKLIKTQALYEARCLHPEYSPVERRAYAARRISSLLARGVLQRQPGVTIDSTAPEVFA